MSESVKWVLRLGPSSAITTARTAGVSGRVMVRADSGYYRRDLITAAVRAKAWFSVTARMDPTVKKAIAAIDEDAWVSIRYPNRFRRGVGRGWSPA